VVGDEKVPYKVALKVEDYLRRSYLYALDIGQRPPQRQGSSRRSTACHPSAN